MPTCSRCRVEKSIEDFAKKNSQRRQSHCRECGREYIRQHYRKNKPYYLERNCRKKLETKRKVLEFLRTQKCIDCGEAEPLYLDFDHRDPALKSFTIGTVLGQGAKSWRTIQNEIAKCDIRCVKCHRRRTAQQFGWFRLDQE